MGVYATIRTFRLRGKPHSTKLILIHFQVKKSFCVIIGIPGIPNAPEVSRAVVGSMRVRLSTDFPGVADEEAIIFFINIAVERTGRRVKRVQENIGSYIAGESVEVTISSRTNLRIGVRYQVTAQVRNPSGTSELSNPESFLAIRGM